MNAGTPCGWLTCIAFAAALTSQAAASAELSEHLTSRVEMRRLGVRRLPLAGAVNFRDLGGYAAAEGKHVRWGLLYRSDALDGLTTADIDLLSRLDVAKITDFRGAAEVARRPDRLPAELVARYVNLPIDDTPARANPEAAKESAAASAAFRDARNLPDGEAKREAISRLVVDYYYPRLPRYGQTAYRRWLQGLLAGPDGSAQIFHCTGGADRTGLAAALLLLSLGVSREDVIKDYLMTNDFLFSDEARALMKQKNLPQMSSELRLQASYLEAAFRAMEVEYGSIDGYIRQGLGIDDSARDKLRKRYLE